MLNSPGWEDAAQSVPLIWLKTISSVFYSIAHKFPLWRFHLTRIYFLN